MLGEILQVVAAGLQLAVLDAVDHLHHGVVHRRGDAQFPAGAADDAVDGVHLAFAPFLQVLEHAGLQAHVLAHGQGEYHERDILLDGVVVVEQGDDILALNGLETDAAGRGDVDALLDEGLDDLAGFEGTDGLAEGAAEGRAQAGERGVDEQFDPAGADEVVLDDDGSHEAEQRFDIVEMAVGEGGERTQLESQAVGRTGELAHAGLQQRGAPGHGAAQHVLGADDAADGQLRNAVLQRHDHAVGREVGNQETDDLVVIQLFGEQKDDVVCPGHFIGRDGLDGLYEVDGAHHMGAFFLERAHVFEVVVDQVDVTAVFRDKGTENRSHGTGAVDGCSHPLIFNKVYKKKRCCYTPLCFFNIEFRHN